VYETFQFNVDSETSITDIRQEIEEESLAGKAVLGKLTGQSPDPDKRDVQKVLDERSYCARVYDERDVEDTSKPAQSYGTDISVRDLKDRLDAVSSVLSTLDKKRKERSGHRNEEQRLTDLYTAVAEVNNLTETVREEIKDELVKRTEPNEEISGEFGVIETDKWEGKELRDDEQVFSALAESDVSIQEVLSIEFDEDSLEELISDDSVDLDPEDIFCLKTSEFVRKKKFSVKDSSTSEREVTGTVSDKEQDREGTRSRSDGNQSKQESKIYFGDGSPIDGWVPIPTETAEREVIPIVKQNEVDDESSAIYMNFSSDLSIGDWWMVDGKVVKQRIEPVVEEKRLDG